MTSKEASMSMLWTATNKDIQLATAVVSEIKKKALIFGQTF